MKELLRRVGMRTRITLLAAGAVAIAVLALSIGVWLLTRHEMVRQVDATLSERALLAFGPGRPHIFRQTPLPHRVTIAPFGFENAFQVLGPDGSVAVPAGEDIEFPVNERDRLVAQGGEGPYTRSVWIEGLPGQNVHLRLITAPRRGGGAIQLARGLVEVDRTMRRLTYLLVLLGIAGTGGAVGAGSLVARSAVRPVQRLTSAAEHVARTKELDAAIDVDREDEIGRLARSFNEMLRALSTSREQQRRLVSDASHELRTPLTSLRTNVEVLSRQADMDPAERERLLADVRSEFEELSTLVAELVELATEEKAAEEEVVDARLDEIVTSAVERARRRSGRTIALDATESVIPARPLSLERAVGCVLDNATKWGSPEQPIKVTVRGGRVEVRDRGPGIADEDRPYVFDRFYRSEGARSMPGSGLGLAITKQVVEAHGGRVWAEEPEGPGALIVIDLPTEEPSPDS